MCYVDIWVCQWYPYIYIYGNIDRAEVGLEPTIFRL